MGSAGRHGHRNGGEDQGNHPVTPPTLATITRLSAPHDAHELAELLADFLARYTNPPTRRTVHQGLIRLFRDTGRRHPDQLTTADLFAWCGRTDLANNTIRQNVSLVSVFLRWCHDEGHTATDTSAPLTRPDSPLRRIGRTYGKVQSANPGRWLTRTQAFDTLITACHDGTPAGLRDEIAIRLGLLGMRLTEIITLTFANIDPDTARITWTGKGRKPRKVTYGNDLAAALTRYRADYTAALGRPLAPTDPVLCRKQPGPSAAGRLAWGTTINDTTYATLLAQRANAAGLGHIAPHDLRRTAAGILHQSTDEHGAHHFDLLDIQKVLGHSDPATTMRSYLDPMDTGVIDRAANFLD